MENMNITTANEELEISKLTLQDTIDKNVEASWKEFQNVPVDRNGNLKAAWYAFPKGTNKNTVYDWFNRHYSKGLSYLMEEVKIMKGTNKHVSCWDKDKRDSGNCFRNYNGNYTEREENMENFNFNAWLKEMLHK